MLLFVCLVGVRSVQAAPIVATILLSKGSNQLQHGGHQSAPTPNASLYIGDIVRTGANGKITILFSDGSQIRLNSKASVQITAPTAVNKGKRSLFRVIGGEIWARLRPNQAAQTASATLGVAGTEFDVLVADDETTTLTVTEGVVDFYNAFGDVSVAASQQSVAKIGMAPTQPVTIPNPGLIVEWRLDLEAATIPREKFFTSLVVSPQSPEIQRRAQLAQQQTNDAAAQRDYGDILFDAHRYEVALTQYQKADAIAPQQSATQMRLGYALQTLNRGDEAEVAFRSAVDEAPVATPERAEALVGLANFQLLDGHPVDAQNTAQQALAAAPNSADAQLVFGLAELRQPGHEAEARNAFAAVAAGNEADLAYQGHAWLAVLDLAQNDRTEALTRAQQAVKMQPNSGLAHGNLALVDFFTGRSREAVSEATLATKLNPDSVAAQVVLGQALLAQGDVDGAARVAAQATALDPALPQAYYLLGVADASRRDYSHAIRDFRQGLDVAPQFLPIVSELARVYNRIGRPKAALALLTNLQQAQNENGAVIAALGEVLYEQGSYPQALSQYQRALQLQPDSALVNAGLARVAIDANHLNEAITAGQRAVSLAPDVGQYHAILGLAYTYSRLDVQAERSYRTALALDPQNALALVQLGLSNQDGDVRTTKRTSGLAFAQGFLQDPAISSELLRGGVNTELAPRAGNRTQDGTVTHRDVANEGDFHFYGRLAHLDDEGDRPNADNREFNARQDTTLVTGPRTNWYFHLFHRRDNNELPGTLSQPVTDDQERFNFSEGILAVRHRLSATGTVYAGLFANKQTDQTFNPNRDLSSVLPGTGLLGVPIRVVNGNQESDALDPEIRFDWRLGKSLNRPQTLTLGAARLATDSHFTRSLLVPGRIGSPNNTGILRDELNNRTNLAYAHFSQHGTKFNLDAQLRIQDVNNDGQQKFTNTRPGGGGLGFVNFSNAVPNSKTYVLPSAVLSYQATRQTAFRLFASRRVTDTTSSILAPAQTLLSTEGQVLPVGLPTTSNVTELDLERQLSGNGLLKLFAFHSTSHNLLLDASDIYNSNALAGVITQNTLLLDRVSREGVGARLERQLDRQLFGQVGVVLSRTAFKDGNRPSRDETPYQPGLIASSSLNYISTHGNKVGVTLNYSSSFIQGHDGSTRLLTPRSPARTTVDLLFSREPSVRQEIYLQITNLFNTRIISFEDVPANKRRWQLGYTRRF